MVSGSAGSETLGPGQGLLRGAAAIPGVAREPGEAVTQGDRGLHKGEFATTMDALGSAARKSRKSSDTKDLIDGRIHGRGEIATLAGTRLLGMPQITGSMSGVAPMGLKYRSWAGMLVSRGAHHS